MSSRPVRAVRFVAMAIIAMVLADMAGNITRAADPPPPLSTVPIPAVPGLNDIVIDTAAAVRLGKALFWDMQVGSDSQACASCHFHAGADNRVKNSVSPGLLAGSTTFELPRADPGPNGTLTPADFPLHELLDPDNRDSAVLFDTDNVISSQGANPVTFVKLRPKTALKISDIGTPEADPVWNVGGVTVRRVEPRNTPTVINAVFNFANFWDGRANNVFNGENPFGFLDQDARIFVNNGVLSAEELRLTNSSLASQAVGPPLSNFEMSFAERTFAELGRKMVRTRPLRVQMVHPSDSVLGPLARTRLITGAARARRLAKGLPLFRGRPGLRTKNYGEMIQAAFAAKFWDSTQIVQFTKVAKYWHDPTQQDPASYYTNNGEFVIIDRPRGKLADNQFTQMEANFGMFFGIAVQLYETTLVSGDTPFDRFMEGDSTALTAQQQEGLDVFLNRGRCANCHSGAEFTNASVQNAMGEGPVQDMVFQAILNGDNEVPPVVTIATGSAELEVDEGDAEIDFSVAANNIVGVTLVQIHAGGAGANGPAIFVLFNSAVDPPFVSPIEGVLTPADFIPGGGLATFAEAITAMNAGLTYVNILTAGNPAGEIRGQLTAPSEGLVEFMNMAVGSAFYDNGFYNIGVRPTADDIGRGGVAPVFINPLTMLPYPLSFSRQALLKRDGLLPAGVAMFVPDLPPGVGDPDPDRVAVDGAIKAPGLRNVELTGPYFRNGDSSTLRQVVDFYTRGGNFHDENIDNLDPDIDDIGGMDETRKDALVSFLIALTDPRVRNESDVFDHPQLFVAVGKAGDQSLILKRSSVRAKRNFKKFGFLADDEFIEIPAVGGGGRSDEGLPPLGTFLNLDPFSP